MTNPPFRLKNAPIVEAILDVECDMPPKYSLTEMEVPATDLFKATYPKVRKKFLKEFTVQAHENTARAVNQGLQSLHFIQPDGKQLVQVRSTGFSFNRLAPYGGFDDYLPEVERTWKEFVHLTKPVQIRLVRMRYINRLMLPMAEQKVDLDYFLRIGPRLSDEKRLILSGFLHQNVVSEVGTDHRGVIVLTSQIAEGGKLPVIFDISVEAPSRESPSNKDYLLGKIVALRSLKNAIFKDTLTEKCLALFQ